MESSEFKDESPPDDVLENPHQKPKKKKKKKMTPLQIKDPSTTRTNAKTTPITNDEMGIGLVRLRMATMIVNAALAVLGGALVVFFAVGLALDVDKLEAPPPTIFLALGIHIMAFLGAHQWNLKLLTPALVFYCFSWFSYLYHPRIIGLVKSTILVFVHAKFIFQLRQKLQQRPSSDQYDPVIPGGDQGSYRDEQEPGPVV